MTADVYEMVFSFSAPKVVLLKEADGTVVVDWSREMGRKCIPKR